MTKKRATTGVSVVGKVIFSLDACAAETSGLSAVNRMLQSWQERGLPHQPVVNIHQLGVVVILEDKLPGPHPSLLP